MNGKISWSISTIKIFLDNADKDLTSAALYNKEYLTEFLSVLRNDYKMMFEDFGEDDDTVIQYFVAINEIRDWIPNLKN
jgi:hypothetical protein